MRIQNIENRLDRIENRLEGMGGRLVNIGRFNRLVERRFNRLANDFETLEAMLKGQETMLHNIANSLASLHNATLGNPPPPPPE